MNIKRKRFLFYPKDILTQVWTFIMSITILYITFIMTYEICFIENPPIFYKIFEYITTIIFGLDIVYNFNKVIVKNKNEIIDCRKKIIFFYLKGWFFIDLISFFPIYFFTDQKILGWTMGLKTLKILKVMNVIRLLRLIKLIKEVFVTKFENPIHVHIQNVKRNIERLYVHFLFILITCHLFSCIFYSFPLIFTPNNNWVINRGFQDRSPFEKYLFSMHWIIETMITVGYGETPMQ